MRNATSLRILYLTAPAEVGGLESVVLDLAQGLTARRHRVAIGAILAESGKGDAMPQRADELGLRVERILVPSRRYLRELRALRRLITVEAPDVVHTHGYRADILGGMAARRAGVPWVSTAHGFLGGGWKAHFYEWLQVRALRSADAVIAVSRLIRQRLQRAGVPPERIEILPNAWIPKRLLSRSEARKVLGVSPDAFLIGWVGRLTNEKGPDIFLDALSELHDLSWEASIVGDGRERTALETRAHRLGIDDRVHWHGVIAGASTLYAAFDAYALTSRTEGAPIALLEAVAAQVPVVAAAVGGVPDMFTDSEILLAPPGRPSEIAAGLRSIALDSLRARDRSGAAFAKLADAFAPDSWLDAHVEVYMRIQSFGGRTR